MTLDDFRDDKLGINITDRVVYQSKDVGFEVVDSDDNNAYLTIREYSEHFFRKFSGFGISEDILLNRSTSYVYVMDKENECIYKFTTEQYLEGERYVDGDDVQRIVPTDDAISTFGPDDVAVHY